MKIKFLWRRINNFNVTGRRVINGVLLRKKPLCFPKKDIEMTKRNLKIHSSIFTNNCIINSVEDLEKPKKEKKTKKLFCKLEDNCYQTAYYVCEKILTNTFKWLVFWNRNHIPSAVISYIKSNKTGLTWIFKWKLSITVEFCIIRNGFI